MFRAKRTDPYESIKKQIHDLKLPDDIHRNWNEIDDISDETFMSDAGSFGKISNVTIHGKDYIMKEMFYKNITEEEMTDDVLNEIVHQSVVSKGQYICPLRGVIVGDKAVMMIMDHCGKGYNTYLRKSPPLETIFKHFGQLCEAIQYLHERSIVHLDIKLDNVMVSADGNLRLIDFGQSMFMERIVHKSVGTLDYQAPEVLHNDAHVYTVSAAVDMWELGATLYEMVTGEKPFGVGRLAEIEERIRNADWDNILLKSRSKHAFVICSHLLVKNPLKRWSVRRVLKYLYVNRLYGQETTTHNSSKRSHR